MYAYHIDRTSSLCKGQQIKLFSLNSIKGFDENSKYLEVFKEGLSAHGKRYFNNCFINIPSNSLYSYLIELIFELIRQTYFQDKLSRFQAFFACETEKELLKWNEIKDSKYPIFKIEFDEKNFLKLDADYLKSGLVFEEINFKDIIMANFVNGKVNIDNINIDNIANYNADLYFKFAFSYWSSTNKDNYTKPELLIKPPINIVERIN